MKKGYLLLGFLASALSFTVNAQDIKLINPDEYDKKKAANELQSNTLYIQRSDFKEEQALPSVPKGVTFSTSAKVNSANCECMVPLDNSFSVAEFSGYSASNQYRNDDASTNAKLLPFNFCFYGTNYNSVYINNNGNVSFGSGYSTYSASGFPSTQFKMVAPFWADVDTRGTASGVVHYKITNDYMIVKWENVGYYSSHTDKLNTFQLIISNGNDSLIPDNNNVAFCYGDMAWTTGDASSGTNGFGGTPATVGANSGNGTSFFQIGRFDAAGTTFVPNATNGNGVSYLDNRTYFFNTCGSATNIAPIANSSAYECGVDTVLLCSNSDSLLLPVSFTGPEANQTVSIVASSATLGSALSTVSNSNGSAVFLVTANPGIVGTHLVTVTATDNGAPNLSTSLNYLINIPNVTLPNPLLSVSPTGAICGNIGATVSVNNCTDYSSIIWADGSTGCDVIVNQTGGTNVTVIASNGCTKTSFQQVNINPAPVVDITGDLNFCNNNNTVLTANVTGITVPVSTYSWSNGSGNQTSTVTSAGQVYVTVTDQNGCIGSDTAIVTNITPTVSISASNTQFCPGVPVTLTASTTGASYAWTSSPPDPYPNSQTITVSPGGSTSYSVQVTENGCVFSSTISLTALTVPIVTLRNDSVCFGIQTTCSASVSPAGAYTITWQPGGLVGSTINSVPGTTYTVTATVGGSCPSNTPTITAIGAFPGPQPSIISQTLTNPLAPDTIMCYKENKTLTATITNGIAPYNYAWSPASGGSASNDTLTILQAGTYYLTITDNNGCVGKDTIEIDLSQPTITLTGNAFICRGDTGFIKANVTTTNNNPFLINWLPTGLGNNDTIETFTAGQYIATAIDQTYGCSASANFNLSYYPNPNGNFTVNPEPSEYGTPAVFTSTSTIASGSITQNYWYFGDGDSAFIAPTQTHTYDAPGSYPVTLITKSNRGCWDTVTIAHEVFVVMPIINIITPNGDNVNNALRFRGLEFFPNSKIKIFNRWGNKIYENDNYQNNWDGKDFEDGTYYYILEVPKLKPQDNILTSFFQIIR
jgi:gliding motility-associated-like protein